MVMVNMMGIGDVILIQVTVMSFLFSGEHHDEECDRLPDGGNLLLGNWARTLCWEGKIVMMMIYIW